MEEPLFPVTNDGRETFRGNEGSWNDGRENVFF